MIKEIHKIKAADFIMSRHYSPVMPRLTKYYCGYYVDDVLQGVMTFGWGTRPKHTIQKLFPKLDTKDYYEIGKMCMDDSMLKNSETQMMSAAMAWLKKKEPNLKYLFTWADGLVGKPGYVYQAFNFLYGGYIWTDTYVTEKGEKVHPRTIQGKLPNPHNFKYGSRPNPKQLKELKLSRVKGKQFRYILPMNKKMRKYLKNSTEKWGINYPKDTALEWKIKKPGETSYTQTNKMPFDLTKEVEYNKSNIDKFKVKNNLDDFFA
jgi:IS1 family transposase|tara:strand:+ start:31 stop:816 length:786 start_codon:yes stop_codon:yes gene_type:complete